MRIKEFEEATGLPRSSIRFYERERLLAPETNGRGNGYREYGSAQVERAVAIRLAKSLGFSLKEIKALIDAWDKGQLGSQTRRTVVAEKIEAVDSKIAALQGMRAYLQAILDWVDKGEFGPKPVFGKTAILRPSRSETSGL